MEIIKKEILVSGTKQFVLEVLNFLVNMVLIVIVMIIGNLLYFDVIEYSKEAAKVPIKNMFLLDKVFINFLASALALALSIQVPTTILSKSSKFILSFSLTGIITFSPFIYSNAFSQTIFVFPVSDE